MGMVVNLLDNSLQNGTDVYQLSQKPHNDPNYSKKSPYFRYQIKYSKSVSPMDCPMIGHKEKSSKYYLFLLILVSDPKVIAHVIFIDHGWACPNRTHSHLKKLKSFGGLSGVITGIWGRNVVVDQKIIVVSISLKI